MTPRPLPLLLLALALTAAACASYTVEGDFAGRPLNGQAEPALTIVLIHNHGFSRAQAGTYRPATPPILRFAADRNPDVVVFSQVRNIANPTAADHRPGAGAPERPGEPPASPRAVRLLRPGQPRRILGRAVRRGVLRRPRPDADRRDPRTDPRAPGRLGPLI